MHCRVNPSPPLTEQNIPPTRRDGMSDSIGCELHLECREMLHHQRGKVSIFAQGEEVLLVQSIDVGFGVFVDDE